MLHLFFFTPEREKGKQRTFRRGRRRLGQTQCGWHLLYKVCDDIQIGFGLQIGGGTGYAGKFRLERIGFFVHEVFARANAAKCGVAVLRMTGDGTVQ